MPEEARAVIVVTSAGPGDGRTFTAVNLAASFSEAGRSVLLVGGDMRRPAVHRYFKLPESAEPTDVVGGFDDERELKAMVRPTSIPGLSVLPGGYRANPAGLLAAQRKRLAACRKLAQVVVVDTPPILVANDAIELMQAADAVVLVGRAGHTTVDAAERASELLRRLAMPVVGVVMTGLTSLPRSYRRYYDSDGDRASEGRRRVPAPASATAGGSPSGSDHPEPTTGPEAQAPGFPR